MTEVNSCRFEVPECQGRLLECFFTKLQHALVLKVIQIIFCLNPELFQKQMNSILKGLDGVTCLMDYVLIHGTDITEHDTRLKKVMDRLEATIVKNVSSGNQQLNGVGIIFMLR